MGHYRSEMVDDYEGYYPSDEELPSVTKENLRWNIARARKAEEELQQMKARLREFKRLMADV